jgi:hypothetical protein
MKANCASVAKLITSGPFKVNDTVKYVRPIAGKKATVEMASTATGIDLIAAARAAFAIDPSLPVVSVSLVMEGVELDDSKSLSFLGITDGSSVQIVYSVKM